MTQLLRTVVVASCAALAATATSASHYPDVQAAQQNAFGLFNSVHSAMRQWGSSVNHNGMSFYLATAPEGSVFYHGGLSPDRPEAFEWLAFEIEHASSFAQSWEPRKSRVFHTSEGPPFNESLAEILLWHQTSHYLPLPEQDGSFEAAPVQRPLLAIQGDDDRGDLRPRPPRFDKPMRAYLQVYRANRPLNLLYIDGQAAAKCQLGSLDSQDLILLGYDSSPSFSGEWQRAGDLCALAEEWAFPAGGKIDGFIRMEAGFEIIKCDFSTAGGLDLVSVEASPFKNESGLEDYNYYIHAFEWFRASAARFHGHPAGRLDVDWSSMVSAFSYPVNLSNPDWNRQDLPRVLNTTKEERRNIYDRLRQVVNQRGGKDDAAKGIVNWQAVVDKIVTRYSERIWYMANGQLTGGALLLLLGTALNPFISYTDDTAMAEQLAMDRCTQHYLDPALLHPETWTPEDRAVAAAIERVSHSICDALFSARNLLRPHFITNPDIDPPVEEAQAIIQQLIEELRWSTWKECGKCPSPDEICSIPMFPVGGVEDYFNPSCKNITGIKDSAGYWGGLKPW